MALEKNNEWREQTGHKPSLFPPCQVDLDRCSRHLIGSAVYRQATSLATLLVARAHHTACCIKYSINVIRIESAAKQFGCDE